MDHHEKKPSQNFLISLQKAKLTELPETCVRIETLK